MGMSETERETTGFSPVRFLSAELALNWEAIAYIVILIIAVLSRFWDLGARVMSHDESLHTKYSWNLYDQGIFAHTPMMHGPLLFHMTALFYFLFGDDDFTSRIYPALIGVLIVMMPIIFRKWLSRTGALITSVLFLISPYILYYSRYIRHDIPAIFFALVMAYSVFKYMEERKDKWLYVLAGAMSLLLASKEVGFIYIAIFGSFFLIYFGVRWYQDRYKTDGAPVFDTLMVAIVTGGMVALGLIGIFTIIPPSTWGDPAKASRVLEWSALVILPVMAVIVLSAAVRYSGFGRHPYPWRLVAIILLVAALIVVGILIVEEVTRIEPSASEPPAPPSPEEEGGLLPPGIDYRPLVLVMAVALVIIGFAVAMRYMGWWDILRKYPEFDVLIVLGTMVLPWATPFAIAAQGLSPTDTTPRAIGPMVITLLPFAAVSIAVGLAWRPKVWGIAAGIFYAIFAFFFTTMFTNGTGLATGLIGSLGYWLEQQGVRRGNQPQYYYLLMVPFYEFLPLIGALGAGFLGLRRYFTARRRGWLARQELYAAEETGQPEADSDELPESGPDLDRVVVEPIGKPSFTLFVGYWAVLIFVALTLAGEKMPWLTTHLTTPLIILSGWYLGQVIDSIERDRFFKLGGWKLALLTPVAVMALIRLVSPLVDGRFPFMGLETQELSITGEWLAAVLVGYLAWLAIRTVLEKIGIHQAERVILITVFALLALLTARFAWMASFINYDYATEYLVYAHSGPDVKIALERIEEIYERVPEIVREGTLVAYDNDSSWPLSWYFRDLPSVFYGASPDAARLDGALTVICGDSHRAAVERLLGDRYYHFQFIRLWWPMQDYFGLTMERIDSVLDFSPQNQTAALLRLGLWDIFWSRDYSIYGQAVGRNFDVDRWPVSDGMHFYVRKDIAAMIWDWGVGAAELAVEEVPPIRETYDNWSLRQAVRMWGGYGVEPGRMNGPRGIAIGPDGWLYVVDTMNSRVSVFSRDGDFLFTWGQDEQVEGGEGGEGNFHQPWGIDVGPDGTVYVADTWNHRVQVFTADGEFIRMWGRLGYDEPPDLFWGPRNVAVGPDGLLYVVDTGNKRIRVYTPDGNWVRDIGSGGPGEGQLSEPMGIAISRDGEIYVADTWNRRVQVLTIGGQYVRQWPMDAWYEETGNLPFLTLDERHEVVYVADPDTCRIHAFTLTGDYVASFGQCEQDIGSFTGFFALGGLEYDPEADELYVVDAGSGRVLVFDMSWIEGELARLEGEREGAEENSAGETGAASEEEGAAPGEGNGAAEATEYIY